MDFSMSYLILNLSGFIGTGLVVIAYAPQIRHLIKEHCSAGISIVAYSLWFASAILFLIHATIIWDVVFISVQVVNLIATCIIMIYWKKYQQQMCSTHLARYRTLSNKVSSENPTPAPAGQSKKEAEYGPLVFDKAVDNLPRS
jgi:uncharacterized protein with PQ loop repeat